MSRIWRWLRVLAFFATASNAAADERFALDTLAGLDARGVIVEPAVHEGKAGIRVVEKVQGAGDALVLLPVTDFRDGTIELELAGRPRADAAPDMRGFVGVAFRVKDGRPLRYECFYVRPTNGRADDQLRRNHATQYVSHPDYPWYRLRKESPGVYESYTDLVPGAWTRVKIVVRGARAELFLHGNEQPSLIVRDMKGDGEPGGIALWVAQGTEAFFRNVTVSP